jgi:hypothetical protein
MLLTLSFYPRPCFSLYPQKIAARVGSVPVKENRPVGRVPVRDSPGPKFRYRTKAAWNSGSFIQFRSVLGATPIDRAASSMLRCVGACGLPPHGRAQGLGLRMALKYLIAVRAGRSWQTLATPCRSTLRTRSLTELGHERLQHARSAHRNERHDRSALG